MKQRAALAALAERRRVQTRKPVEGSDHGSASIQHHHQNQDPYSHHDNSSSSPTQLLPSPPSLYGAITVKPLQQQQSAASHQGPRAHRILQPTQHHPSTTSNKHGLLPKQEQVAGRSVRWDAVGSTSKALQPGIHGRTPVSHASNLGHVAPTAAVGSKPATPATSRPAASSHSLRAGGRSQGQQQQSAQPRPVSTTQPRPAQQPVAPPAPQVLLQRTAVSTDPAPTVTRPSIALSRAPAANPSRMQQAATQVAGASPQTSPQLQGISPQSVLGVQGAVLTTTMTSGFSSAPPPPSPGSHAWLQTHGAGSASAWRPAGHGISAGGSSRGGGSSHMPVTTGSGTLVQLQAPGIPAVHSNVVGSRPTGAQAGAGTGAPQGPSSPVRNIMRIAFGPGAFDYPGSPLQRLADAAAQPVTHSNVAPGAAATDLAAPGLSGIVGVGGKVGGQASSLAFNQGSVAAPGPGLVPPGRALPTSNGTTGAGMPAGASSSTAASLGPAGVSLEGMGAIGAPGTGFHHYNLGMDEPDPEEERRKARRRHRKRVARIVVDHWKWFAQERLQALHADRHRRRTLMAAAFVTWHAEVSAAGMAYRMATVHATKRAYLLLGTCLLAWRRVAQGLKDVRARGRRLAASHTAIVQRGVLQAWQSWRAGKALGRKQEMQATFFYAFTTLTRSMVALKSVTARWRAQRLQLEAAAAHYVAALKRRAMHAWRAATSWARLKKEQIKVADAWFRGARILTVLQSWHQLRKDLAAARQDAALLLLAAERRWLIRTAQDAFYEWLAIAKRMRELRQILATAQARVTIMRLLGCLRAWALWAPREKELRLAAGMLAPLGRRWRMRVAWEAWGVAVELTQGQRGEELRAKLLCKACLRTLSAYVGHCARKSELLAAGKLRVAHTRLGALLSAWQQEAKYLKAKAKAVHEAVKWHTQLRVRQVLRAWSMQAQYQRARKSMVVAAEAHHAQRLQQGAWRAWVLHTRWQRLKRDVADWARRRMQHAVLDAWGIRAQEKIESEHKHALAEKHRRITVLSSCLMALRTAVVRRADKLALWGRMAAHYHRLLMTAALSGWAHQVLPMAAEERARAAKAALHWKRRILARALQGWEAEAARRAVKHGREREADEFAAGNRALRTLDRWQAGIYIQRQRRAEKARVLQEAQEHLQMAATARIFTAWHEVHVAWVIKRFKEARAAGAFRERVERRCLAAWKAYVQHAARKHLLLSRALRHWALRCKELALSAWKVYTAGRIAKKAAQRCACAHRAKVLQAQGLAALRWYIAERQRKRADEADALAMHQRYYQRIGVEAWLRVGLARRQERLANLAQTQARVLAAELQLVAPYARRWRRAAAEAAAARRAAEYQTQLASLGLSWQPPSSSAWSQPPSVAGAQSLVQHQRRSHCTQPPAAAASQPVKTGALMTLRPMPTPGSSSVEQQVQLLQAQLRHTAGPQQQSSKVAAVNLGASGHRKEPGADHVLAPPPAAPMRPAPQAQASYSARPASAASPAPSSGVPVVQVLTPPAPRVRPAPRMPAFLLSPQQPQAAPQQSPNTVLPSPAVSASATAGSSPAIGDLCRPAGFRGAALQGGLMTPGRASASALTSATMSHPALAHQVLDSPQQQHQYASPPSQGILNAAHRFQQQHINQAALQDPLALLQSPRQSNSQWQQPQWASVITTPGQTPGRLQPSRLSEVECEVAALDEQLLHCRSLQSEVAALEVAVASAAAVAGTGASSGQNQQHPADQAGARDIGDMLPGGGVDGRRLMELQHQLQEAREALAHAWPQVAAAAERVRLLRRAGLPGPGGAGESVALST